MKKNSWITWLVIFIAGFAIVQINPQIIPTAKKEIEQTSASFQPYVYLIKANLESKLGGTTETTTENQVGKVATPTEEPLKDMKTSNIYYYHFNKNVPESVRQSFLRAITAYNNTGIVKLVPGNAESNQNSITFFVYHKQINNIASGTVELGSGGPSALQLNHYAINSAKAGINLTYPQLAIKDSVTMHELGHALGLAHSSYSNSVMYPVDRGITKLSSGDINGLKNIYQQ